MEIFARHKLFFSAAFTRQRLYPVNFLLLKDRLSLRKAAPL